VVTGAGRGFCAGADTRALEGHVERGGYDAGTPPDLARPGYGVRPEFDADFAYHFGMAKPVIAAVNGPAAGVGFALACYCDLRFAAAGAKLTTSHGRLGLPAEYGLSWLLPRLIGLTRAADLLLSSRVVLAEEAAPGARQPGGGARLPSWPPPTPTPGCWPPRCRRRRWPPPSSRCTATSTATPPPPWATRPTAWRP
jgi:hypothetical protein